MSHQWACIHQMFHSPRKAFLSIPSDRLYVMSWLGPFLYGVIRNFRTEGLAERRAQLGGNGGILVLIIALGIVVVPVSCWFTRQILKLFGKRLSVTKIMNIWGHALVPRLTIGIPALLLMRAYPLMFILLPGERSLPLFCFGILQLVAILYTMYLFIYGLVVSPSEGTEGDAASSRE